MALPTQPTAALITTEALKRKLNGGSPASADVTRATDYGLEKVKRDIMRASTLWKPLETVSYDITVDGISKYALPSDCEKLLGVTIFKGEHTDTLSAVSSTSSVTLAADEDASEDEVVGNYLLITSGTGVNQCVQVDDYSTTTKVCTMAEAYGTLCVSGDGYLICDDFYPLDEDPSIRRGRNTKFSAKGTPSRYYPFADATYGYIELDPVPDGVWGIQFHYCADLRRIDLTATTYTTILRRWAGVLEQGVYVWTLGEDDDRYQSEHQLYMTMLQDLRARDGYMMEASQLQRRMVE